MNIETVPRETFIRTAAVDDVVRLVVYGDQLGEANHAGKTT